MNRTIHLRRFTASELLLDEAETRTILKFFFQDNGLPERIEQMVIDDQARSFAQGLIVEAIDMSYQMGFVEALILSIRNPSHGATKIIKSFAKRSLRHWFKHATAQDLQDVKVYDSVRKALAFTFATYMNALLQGVAKNGSQAPTALARRLAPLHIEQAWS